MTPCAGPRILAEDCGLHRHLHLATSASLAAFIGIIGVGGLVLLQQTIGRPLSPNVAVSDRDTSNPVQGRDIIPVGENRSLGADAPPGRYRGRPRRLLPDEPAEQTANVTERTALPTPSRRPHQRLPGDHPEKLRAQRRACNAPAPGLTIGKRFRRKVEAR